MLKVTDGVHAVTHVDGLVRHHLDLLALKYALGLLGDHIGDACLAGVEVVVKLVHLVSLGAFRHFREALPFTREGVFLAPGIHGVGIHVILYVVCGELHVLVLDRSAAVIVDHASAAGKIRDDGVLGGRECGDFQGALAQEVQGIGA